jgi:hypothetical protein
MEKPKMSNFVFVLDTDKQPLEPIHPGLARQLLKGGKAAIYRKYPFTLILKESRPEASTPSLEVKIDLATTQGRVAGISYRYCTPTHKKDGYAYGY